MHGRDGLARLSSIGAVLDDKQDDLTPISI